MSSSKDEGTSSASVDETRKGIQETVTLEDGADITLKVIEYEFDYFTGRTAQPLEIKKVTYFEMTKKTMMSLVARMSRQRPPFDTKSLKSNMLEATDDMCTAWEILFHLIPETSAAIAMPEPQIQDIWDMIALLKKYSIKSEIASPWFNEWIPAKIDKLRIKNLDHRDEMCDDWDDKAEHSWWFREYGELLYPCYEFNAKEQFNEISKELVYHSIHPVQPPYQFRHREIDMPRKVYNNLNHARGRLRRMLFSRLWSVREDLIDRHKCKYQRDLWFNHEQALIRYGVWPVELRLAEQSIRCALQRLESYGVPTATNDCTTCNGYDFANHVEADIAATAGWFEGLCLDCMHRSRQDRKEFLRIRSSTEYSKECDIKHGEPTSFCSNMGDRLPRRG